MDTVTVMWIAGFVVMAGAAGWVLAAAVGAVAGVGAALFAVGVVLDLIGVR